MSEAELLKLLDSSRREMERIERWMNAYDYALSEAVREQRALQRFAKALEAVVGERTKQPTDERAPA